MPTYTERRDALKLRAMQQRWQFARLQIENERKETQHWRTLCLQQAEIRRTSIAAAEKAIRRLRKGRDNARAELAALKATLGPPTYTDVILRQSAAVATPVSQGWTQQVVGKFTDG